MVDALHSEDGLDCPPQEGGALAAGGLGCGAEGGATDDLGEKDEAVLLAQLINLLSQRPRHSLLLSDLGALVPAALRQRVKDCGGLRSWLQRYQTLFAVKGQPGKESVTLTLGSQQPPAPSAAAPAAESSELRRIGHHEGADAGAGAGAEPDAAAGAATRPAAAAAAPAAPAEMVQSSPGKSSEGLAATEEDVENLSAVQFRGLPYQATVEDIRAFLGERFVSQLATPSPGPDSQTIPAIHLIHNRDGRPSGYARVQFATAEAAAQCRDERHNCSMGDRYVEVFLFSERPGGKSRLDRTAKLRGEEASGSAGADLAGGRAAATGPGGVRTTATGPGGCLPGAADAAAGVTREQVVRECRDQLAEKRRALLSMLGVALSPGARAYLKHHSEGLKHFLAQHPLEFSIEGGKGSEHVTYTPQQSAPSVLELSEALFTPRSKEAQSAQAYGFESAGLAGGANTSASSAAATAASTLEAVSTAAAAAPADVDVLDRRSTLDHLMASPVPARTPKDVMSAMSAKDFQMTPSDWGEIEPPKPGSLAYAAQAAAAVMPPWQSATGGTQPSAAGADSWMAVQAAMQAAQAASAPGAGGAGASAASAQAAALAAANSAAPWQMALSGWPLASGFPAWGGEAAGSTAASFWNAAAMAQAHQAAAAVGQGPSGAEGAAGAEDAAQQGVRSVRLRGLPFTATEQDLLALFSQYDIVDRIAAGEKAVKIILRSNGRPSGQAVVHMKTPADVKLAQDVLQFKYMGARYVEVFPNTEEWEGGGGLDRVDPARPSGDEDRARGSGAATAQGGAGKAKAGTPGASGPSAVGVGGAAGSTAATAAAAAAAAAHAQVAQAQLPTMMPGGMAPWQCASAWPGMPGAGFGGMPQAEAPMNDSWEALFQFPSAEGFGAMAASMAQMQGAAAAGAGAGGGVGAGAGFTSAI